MSDAGTSEIVYMHVHVTRPRPRPRALLLALLLSACGGTSPAPPPAHRALGDAPADGSNDLVVARVDGHPVWGSCVAAQATRTHGDRAAALRDCVDFELLAWRAAAAGYADDPDVALATRTAMVRAVIDDYEDHVTPAELEPTFDRLVARAAPSMRHDEFRGSSYVRVNVAHGAPPDVDARAHAVADKIAAALAGEVGLSGPDLMPIAQPIADAAGVGSDLDHDDVVPTLPIGLEPHYAALLYGIPEVGRTAGPVRTKWGWDVVLFASDVPPEHATDEAIAEAVLLEGRRVHFPLWVAKVAHALGVTPLLEPDVDRTLEEAP